MWLDRCCYTDMWNWDVPYNNYCYNSLFLNLLIFNNGFSLLSNLVCFFFWVSLITEKIFAISKNSLFHLHAMHTVFHFGPCRPIILVHLLPGRVTKIVDWVAFHLVCFDISLWILIFLYYSLLRLLKTAKFHLKLGRYEFKKFTLCAILRINFLYHFMKISPTLCLTHCCNTCFHKYYGICIHTNSKFLTGGSTGRDW